MQEKIKLYVDKIIENVDKINVFVDEKRPRIVAIL